MDLSYGAVVYRKRKETEYLLVHHAKSSHWDMPKGHPKKKETPEETAEREVLEETNYQIRLVPGFRESIRYYLPQGEEKTVVFFLGIPLKEKKNRINPQEIQDVQWLSLEDALKKLTYENSRGILRSADQFLKEHEE